MASGYGPNGGPTVCFPFWQEVLACYVVNTNADDDSGKRKCAPVLEDYLECLHHKKEHARVAILQKAYRQAEKQNGHEGAQRAEDVRTLGLIKASDAEKNIRHGNLLPTLSRN